MADALAAPPDSRRLFFALAPPASPASLSLALHDLACCLARRFGGRISEPEDLHLTLAFLGQVPAARLPELCRLATGLPFAPFRLSLDEVGLWRHNRLVWAGCRTPPPVLGDLAESLRRKLVAADFAVDRTHPFTPHVTLLRQLPASRLDDVEAALPVLAPLAWPIGELVLFASAPLPGGRTRYTALARFTAN